MKMETAEWPAASTASRLRTDAVHLWRAPLDPVPELEAALSAEECTRAGRFRFDRDRQRFIASRAILRTILASYAGIGAAELRFVEGPHGKPELAGNASALRFNLSHSGSLMLLAVTQARELGVDIERVRDDVAFETLAEKYFAHDDAWELRKLPPEQRAAKFYDVWTCTEARLKADGIGIHHGLHVAEPERWSVATVTPADGYVAALAVEGGDFQLECWSWRK